MYVSLSQTCMRVYVSCACGLRVRFEGGHAAPNASARVGWRVLRVLHQGTRFATILSIVIRLGDLSIVSMKR